MLNHNIINLILKKAGKCHCWKDSIKDYCFDHTIDPDDYYYMSMEQYTKYFRKSNKHEIGQKIKKYNGYAIIIHKETHKWISFSIRRHVSTRFTSNLEDSRRMLYNKYTKQFKRNCNCLWGIENKELHHINDIYDHYLRYLCSSCYENKSSGCLCI